MNKHGIALRHAMSKSESIQPKKRRSFLRRFKNDQEKGAREAVIEELFNDFNRSRFSVYKFNFFRGIFFGLGSVLGGTIVVGLVIWLLAMLGSVIPPLHDFLSGINHTIQARGK